MVSSYGQQGWPVRGEMMGAKYLDQYKKNPRGIGYIHKKDVLELRR